MIAKPCKDGVVILMVPLYLALAELHLEYLVQLTFVKGQDQELAVFSLQRRKSRQYKQLQITAVKGSDLSSYECKTRAMINELKMKRFMLEIKSYF